MPTAAVFREDDRQLLFKRANRLWHTDLSFHPVRATYSLLSAHHLPPGGGPDTEFADLRAAYDALPQAMKARLEHLVAWHSYWHSRVLGGGPEATKEERESRPPAAHRLVQIHPGSGRKTLYLASHAFCIDGMDDEAARALLEELTGLRHRAPLRLRAQMAPGRRRHLGQPLHHAPGDAVRRSCRSAAMSAAPRAAKPRSRKS